MTDTGAGAMRHDRWRVLPAWAVFAAGAVAFWVVGFLPWIVMGMHLDVSSAWVRFDTLLGPIVALPFNEYAFTQLFVSSVIGGTAALAVSRLAAPTVSHPRLLATVGAVVAVGASLAQTYAAVRPGRADTNEARVLVAVLVAAVLVSGAFGILVGALAAGSRGWGRLLGAATAAAVSGPWLSDLVHRSPQVDPQWLVNLTRWTPWVSGTLLGLVLALFGFRPATRLLGWALGLAIGWAVPSLLTAVAYVSAYGSQGTWNRSRVPEIVDAGRDVFVQSLSPSIHPVGPHVAAVVVGLVGAVVVASRRPAQPA